MNESTPRPVRAGHRVGLLANSAQAVSPKNPQNPSSTKRWALSLLTVVGLALLASACSANPLAKSSAGISTRCADKVAQASIQGSVPGLWSCLDYKFQQSMGGSGTDGSLVSQPFASSYKLIGSSADAAYYEITLTDRAAQQNGFHKLGLIVWVDVDGRVAGFNVGSSPA